MLSLDKTLRSSNHSPVILATFDDIRRELEAAGFATRSH
jgi:hypothetical protein